MGPRNRVTQPCRPPQSCHSESSGSIAGPQASSSRSKGLTLTVLPRSRQWGGGGGALGRLLS